MERRVIYLLDEVEGIEFTCAGDKESCGGRTYIPKHLFENTRASAATLHCGYCGRGLVALDMAMKEQLLPFHRRATVGGEDLAPFSLALVFKEG